MSAIEGNGKVGNGTIFGFPAPVAHNGIIAVELCHGNRIDGFGEGSYLVNLYQQGIGRICIDSFLETGNISNKKIVAHYLAFSTKGIR